MIRVALRNRVLKPCYVCSFSTRNFIPLRDNDRQFGNQRRFVNNNTKPLVETNTETYTKPLEADIDMELEENGSKVPLVQLFGLLRPYPGHLALCTSAVIVSSMATMAIPHLFGEAIDALANVASISTHIPSSQPSGALIDFEEMQNTLGSDAWNSIKDNAMMYVGVSVLGAMGYFGKTASLEILGERVGRSLREELYENMLRQDLSFFDANRSGELANRLSTDVHEVAEHLVENAAILLNSGVTAVAASGFLIYTSPQLAMISLSVVPVMGFAATYYSGRMKRLSKFHLNSLAQATQMASERFSSIHLVKFFDSGSEEVNRYGKKVEESFQFAREFAMLQGTYVGSIFLVSNMTLLAVVVAGSSMILEGTLTVGSLAAFCMYANMLGESTSELTEGISGVVRAQGAGSRLFELRKRVPQLHHGKVDPKVPSSGSIRFKDVHFSYPSKPERPVLNGLSLEVNPGETVCVTGASGCGKSTLAYLLAHMYRLESGTITLDGNDVRTLHPSYLRRQVATVSQDPLMLAGTIWDNVTYGIHQYPESNVRDHHVARPHRRQPEHLWDLAQLRALTGQVALVSSAASASGRYFDEAEEPLKEWVRHCARVCNAAEFIEQLDDGYDSLVGEHGVTLSGGQMQRLSLCRALVSRPRILVLDEATSALDIENELAIQESIQREMSDITCLVISHHLQILEAADKVAIMDKGKVKAFGTFDELKSMHLPLLEVLTNKRM